jgi:hypothetical protein
MRISRCPASKGINDSSDNTLLRLINSERSLLQTGPQPLPKQVFQLQRYVLPL